MNNGLSSSDQGQNQNPSNEPRKGFKYKSTHPVDNFLTDINIGVRTRSLLRNFCTFFSFVSHIEPKHYVEALKDPN